MTNALQLIERPDVQQKIVEVFPSYMLKERFFSLALSTFRKNPKLQKCSQPSILQSVMECAKMGLEPGMPNEANLVPFKDECSLIVGYKGLMKCALRSPDVVSIWPRTVCENDIFEEYWGTESKLIHRPPKSGPRGETIGFYALAKLANGEYEWEYRTVKQIEEHRDKYAKGAHRADSAWKTSFESMALKTVIRQVCKYLPQSAELVRALDQEESGYKKWEEATRDERRQELLDSPDILVPEEATVEINKLQKHISLAAENKIDIASVVKDTDALIKERNAAKLRAVNDQLGEFLEQL